jgi:hypothetical protein
MTKANGRSAVLDQDDAIRQAVAEMCELVSRKNAIRERMRALGAQLHAMVEESPSELVNSLRDVLMALGAIGVAEERSSYPVVVSPPVLPVMVKSTVSLAPKGFVAGIQQTTKKATMKVMSNRYKLLQEYMAKTGSVKAEQAKKALGFDVSQYLTKMKQTNVVLHDPETATWCLPGT